MAVLERGPAPPPKGKGRTVLSVRDPLVETLLAGLGVEAETIAELRHFSKSLVRDRNQWDIRRRGGLFAAREIPKDAADALLKRELAKLAEGGVE
jgi:hypothetical protein